MEKCLDNFTKHIFSNRNFSGFQFKSTNDQIWIRSNFVMANLPILIENFCESRKCKRKRYQNVDDFKPKRFWQIYWLKMDAPFSRFTFSEIWILDKCHLRKLPTIGNCSRNWRRCSHRREKRFISIIYLNHLAIVPFLIVCVYARLYWMTQHYVEESNRIERIGIFIREEIHCNYHKYSI